MRDDAPKDELLSRLLGHATSACNKLNEDVAPNHFVAAREVLHSLRDGLRDIYMAECIPY